MPVSEKERAALYKQLTQNLGPKPAETLMEYLPPKTWDELATKEDVRLMAKELRAEMTQLRGELRAELQSEISGLRGEMQAGFATIESRFAEQTRAMAQQTRTVILTVAGFALTVWVSLLVALP